MKIDFSAFTENNFCYNCLVIFSPILLVFSERLVNGHANKAVEPSHLKPTFTSKDKNIKKARVEDIIMNLKKGKTVATTKRKVNNESSSFISMCTIREEPDDDEIRDLPPLKSSPVFQQPEVKGNSNTVFLLQTSKQTQPAPSSTPYLGKAPQTAPPSKSPVKQVINQNIIQRKVQKHDRYQMPLLLSKVPPGNVMNSDLLSNNAVNQKTTPNVLNSPSQPQKQLLLITRPGTPLYLAHNLKIHDRQGGSSKLSMKPLNVNTCTAVTTSHPMSEVQAANTTSPLVTLQYHLPNSDKAGKMVNLSNKYTYQVAPVQTSGSVPNLNCNETMSSLSDSESVPVAEMPRATKSLEIPISFAGNQPAHVTTISDEPGVVMQRRSNFVPSYVRGMANDMFSARKNLKQHNVSSSVEGRGKTALPIGHSGQNVAGNKKTDRGAAHKNIKSQESGKESFPAKKSSNISRIRANFPRSVDLDDISRTLSNEHSKPAQPKTSVTIVRMSNRKKHQTEKAKLLDKIKRKTKKCYKEPLKLRYSKKVKAKEKAQIKVKTEPVDECLATNPSVVNSSNVSEGTDKLTVGSPVKLLTKKGNELRENAQDGATSLPEVVNSSDDGQDSGNLFRDPALLTREERALQRALLMFKEMEAKQSRKNVRVGGKRSLRRRIKLKQVTGVLLIRLS